MKIKTSELTGKTLAYAVHMANGGSYWTSSNAKWDTNEGYTDWVLDKSGLNRYVFDGSRSRAGHWEVLETWTPDTDWAQGGPIIERKQINLLHRGFGGDSVWWAAIGDADDEETIGYFGPTSLIAAMRCDVASELGDEVEVPQELF
jgi:Protein of unknown function (DUF2591)